MTWLGKREKIVENMSAVDMGCSLGRGCPHAHYKGMTSGVHLW